MIMKSFTISSHLNLVIRLWWIYIVLFIRSLSRLEKSCSYRKWATDQRKFLRNREMILQDPELGPKARCVPHDNNLALSHNDLGWDLEEILRANPYHTATREYAGAHFLLAKNLQSFKDFLDEFMAGQPLPKSFKEAVLILSEKEPELIGKWNIDQETLKTAEGATCGRGSAPNSETLIGSTTFTTKTNEKFRLHYYHPFFFRIAPAGWLPGQDSSS